MSRRAFDSRVADRTLGALRRLSTLVSERARPEDMFAAAAEEIARLVHVPCVTIARHEPDGSTTECATVGDVDDTSARATVGAPVVVAGRVWGAIHVSAPPEDLPEDTEERLVEIVELVAPAIGAVTSRDAGERLAAEQAALRELAGLVGLGAPEAKLFAAVAEELVRVSGVDISFLARYEPDATATILASHGERSQLRSGLNWRHDTASVTGRVYRTGRPTRMEDDEISTAGAPVFVADRLWGVAAVSARHPDRLPGDVERRLVDFAALVAIALANAEARAAPERVAAEEAALRRVATLVAQDVPPGELFAAVAREVGTLLGGAFAAVAQIADGTVVTVAAWAAHGAHPPVPDWPVEPGDLPGMLAETRRAAHRTTDWTGIPGQMAAFLRDELGVGSTVSCPIVVAGRMWGLLAVHYRRHRLPLPPGERLVRFADLAARSIANTAARAEVARLAQEQAGLRRVATLVAQEASEQEVFAAIAEEIGQLVGAEEVRLLRYERGRGAVVVGAWGPHGDVFPVGTQDPLGGENVTSLVFRTGRPARVDNYVAASGSMGDRARSGGMSCVVGAPVVVEGGLWGTIAVGTVRAELLPPDTEPRLAQFTELMATTIANTESRARADRLALEQAALRRVATLVAAGGAPDEIFAAVGDEVRQLVGNDLTSMFRREPGDSLTLVAVRSREPVPDDLVGTRLPMRETFTRFLEARRPVRLDRRATAQWMVDFPAAAPLGLQSALGVPIVVAGRPWGALFVCDKQDVHRPPEAARAIKEFTDLVATAIANADARAEIGELAEEQAALRRVATLVAEEGPPREVFARVAEEVANVLGGVGTSMWRDEGDGTATAVAVCDIATPVGTRLPTDGDGVIASVLRDGRPVWRDGTAPTSGAIAARGRELGIRSAIGCPIVVRGRIWGALGAARHDREPLARETETRLARFAALVATAIGNAEARAEVERLAEEQAALRRVATLVAAGVSPAAVLDAVAAETRALLGADGVLLCRYEEGDEVTCVAHPGTDGPRLTPGARTRYDDAGVTAAVRRTHRPARRESYTSIAGRGAELALTLGVGSAVGAPIFVDGRLWGVTIATWGGDSPPPRGTEHRLAQFAELLDSAIANADSRDQLTASRARLLTAGDDARRRVVRDLHDGAQQRLVHTVVTLKLARRALRDEDERAGALVDEALAHAEAGNAELRELAHGILPAVLARGGLRAGVRSFVARLDLPVRVDVTPERFASQIEASAYFIVAEALTNVTKHARAGGADVTASVHDGTLRIEVRDDGTGGADPRGHGLVGMGDRAAALGGALEIESPPGGGTRVAAALPI